MDTRVTYSLLLTLINIVLLGSATQTVNKTKTEGDDVFLPCPTSVPEDDTDVSVYWTSETDPTFTGNKRDLTFQHINRNDTGVYVCHEYNATDGTNTTVEIVHLDIQYPVEIRIASIDHETLMVNDRFNLTFTIGGNPKPSYVVKRANNDPAILGRNTSVTGPITFTSPRMRCQDSGIYTVTASNSLSSATKVVSENVTVLCPPTPSDNTTYKSWSRLGEAGKFTMTTYGYPHPNFTWYRVDNSLSGSQRDHTASYLSISEWTVANVSVADYGTYGVEMQNEYGTANAMFTLLPNGPPEGVTDLSVGVISKSSATLTWRAGYDYGSTQTFTVYRLDMATGRYTITLSAFTDTSSSHRMQQIERVVDGLVSDTDYNITIQSSNIRGHSAMSPSVAFKTGEESRSPAAVIVGSIIGGIVGLAVLVFVFYKVVLPVYRKSQSEKGELSIEEMPGKGVNQTAKWRASVTMPYRPSVC